jgi:hypothetical protein
MQQFGASLLGRRIDRLSTHDSRRLRRRYFNLHLHSSSSFLKINKNYMDETGISKPRVSAKGKDLPTTRHISAVHHHDMGYHDHAVTVFLISWGQAIDHDMTFTADTKGSDPLYLMTDYPFSNHKNSSKKN